MHAHQSEVNKARKANEISCKSNEFKFLKSPPFYAKQAGGQVNRHHHHLTILFVRSGKQANRQTNKRTHLQLHSCSDSLRGGTVLPVWLHLAHNYFCIFYSPTHRPLAANSRKLRGTRALKDKNWVWIMAINKQDEETRQAEDGACPSSLLSAVA